ncbi:GAF domain-containing sensor histidine kinase [Subtercola boreus]|nr:GAF domain-containing protein [Subtercola boreus]
MTFPDQHRGDLDVALVGLVDAAHDVMTTESRLRALLKANRAVVEQLDLPTVLRRIVEAAVELVGAQYGALGVIAPSGGLDQFIHVGMAADEVSTIGHLPEGKGLLGALIDAPHPIRLDKIGNDPRSSGFPPGHPPMDSFLGVPVRVRNEVYGNLYLSNQANGLFTDEDEQLVTALAATAGIAIENARLFAETKRRQAWSAASAEITSALLSGERHDSISLIVNRVLGLSGADLVCVLLPTDEPGTLVVETASGLRESDLQGARVSAAQSVSGTVLEGKQPRLLDDSDIALPGKVKLGPVMAVPLISAGTAEGVLFLARAQGAQFFTAADLEMAADFAGQASVAMQLGRARGDRQKLALLEDRGRIARDLHDHVIQEIFGTGLELQSIAGRVQNDQLAERIGHAVANLDGSISQIRTVIFALSAPVEKSRNTIRHSIIDIVNELAPSLTTTPYVSFSGPVDLLVTGDLAGDVAAVMRETLTNTARHASAEHSSVSLTASDGRIILEVTDDGHGTGTTSRRSGLANIEKRAALRGGTSEFHSSETGTTVRWSVPYSLSPDAQDGLSL